MKPPWLKVRAPTGTRYRKIKKDARKLRLHTVCEEAHCPNIGECWSGGTATFMVMGEVCTRGCRFCAVNTRRNGSPLDPEEPVNVAKAIAQLQLDYVVITSVDRDDLPDQGASHFAACIEAIREKNPETLIEVLVPDFQGRTKLLNVVLHAQPNVLAHNVECVRSVTRKVRDPRANYDQSLHVLRTAKKINPTILTKTSLMVGVGETNNEIIEAMSDIIEAHVDFLTIGQYLQPSSKHLKIERFVHPTQFTAWKEIGEKMGFQYVASGPLVRSSYRAGEFFIKKYLHSRERELL